MTTINPIHTGVATHIGSYADAAALSGGGTQVFVSGTPGLREDGTPPEDFTDHGALLQELVRRHEPALAAWPEAVERPLRRFAPVTPEDVARFGYDEARYFATYRI